MLSPSSASSDSVLDEIRSTIASFESLRTAASHRRRETSLGTQSTRDVLLSSHGIVPPREISSRLPVTSSDPIRPAFDGPAPTGQSLVRADSSPVAPRSLPAAKPAAEIRATARVSQTAAPVETHFDRMVAAKSQLQIPECDTECDAPPAVSLPQHAEADSHEPHLPAAVAPEPVSIASSMTAPGQPANTHLAAAEHNALDAELNIAESDLDDIVLPEEDQPAPSTAAGKDQNPTVWFRTVDKTAKIMIIDDEPLNVMTFRQHLKMEGYENFVTTSDAREALRLLRSELPDVVLLDIRMPGINGLDILRVVGLDPVLQHIPVLILTAAADPETRKQALDMGASDFLQKPIDPNELLPRVRNAVVIKKHYDMAASEAARLEQQVERRTRQLEATRQQLILCLARAAEHRDNDTGNHVIRVGRYTSIIARTMGYPEHKLEMLEQAAQLHDVGKIGIPDSILFKPGKLHRDEYELMKKHCAMGKQIIEPISEKDWNILKTHTRIGESMLHVRSSSLLMLAARIAQTHHEHWNGNGYPLGLKGEDIPVEGRIVAVADVFDALSSRRPYKEPFPRQKCFDILAEGRGTQFDPQVVDAFFACSAEIVEVQLLLMDDEDRISKCSPHPPTADTPV